MPHGENGEVKTQGLFDIHRREKTVDGDVSSRGGKVAFGNGAESEFLGSCCQSQLELGGGWGVGGGQGSRLSDSASQTLGRRRGNRCSAVEAGTRDRTEPSSSHVGTPGDRVPLPHYPPRGPLAIRKDAGLCAQS